MARKPKEESKKPVARIGALTLMGVEIDFDPHIEGEEEIEATYNAAVTIPRGLKADDEPIENVIAFKATMSIEKGRKGAGEFTTRVVAAYFCAMKCKDATSDHALELAKSIARTTIWSNFTSLAAVVTQQMHAEFPVLPPHPGKVTVDEDDGIDDSDGEQSEN